MTTALGSSEAPDATVAEPAPNAARRALVVGLGISGIATAVALRQAGWAVEVVEKAAERRRGGYFIGLFGMGRHAAGHLGMVDNLHDRGKGARNYKLTRAGLGGPTVGFADAPENVGPWMMLRGDVENAAYAALPDDTPVHYSTRPVQIKQDDKKVRVNLKNTRTGEETTNAYDLVVGADGIHSSVREQVFGPHEKYTHSLHHMICAFELPENPPTLGPGTGAILTEPGRSFWVFPFMDHPATVIFTYYTDDSEAERTRPVVERLREVYGPAPFGDVMDYALKVLENTDEYLFDTTAQIRMPTWREGRVVLTGDAAWCPTLYSGMGATSALGAADLLGVLLTRHPDDLDAALDTWEATLRPLITDFQKAGIFGRRNFVADNKKELRQRNILTTIMRTLMSAPFISRLMARAPFIAKRHIDLRTRINERGSFRTETTMSTVTKRTLRPQPRPEV